MAILPDALPITFGPSLSDTPTLPATLPFNLSPSRAGTIGAALRKPAAVVSGAGVRTGIIRAAVRHPTAILGGTGVRTATVAAKLRHPTAILLAHTAINLNSPLAQQCQATWDITRRYRRNEDLIRRQQPLARIWDAEWTLQHLCSVEYKARFSWISNDSGPGRIEIPADKPVAQWIIDQEGRIARGEGRNVHITIDYCGARWGGRLDKYSVEQREDGDVVLVCDFLHDYENVKWYSVWSNPFL